MCCEAEDSELAGALKGVAHMLRERGIKYTQGFVPKTHTLKQPTQRQCSCKKH